MPKEIRLEVRGMHCAACVARVEKALRSVPGVSDARVNLVMHRAVVHASNDSLDPQVLVNAVETAGYEAIPLSAASEEAEEEESPLPAPWTRDAEERRTRFRQLVLGIVALAIIWPTMLSPHLAQFISRWPAILAATVVQLSLGTAYAASAWRQLRRGGVNMDTLVAAGTWTAYLAGMAEVFGSYHASLSGLSISHNACAHGFPMYLSDAAMILTVITLGKYLEIGARLRASLAMRQLVDLSPAVARLVGGDSLEEVPVRSLRVGDLVRVLPGEKVPIDGIITEGESEIDESWLTGESVPVVRSAGEEVFAGTINLTGILTVRTARPARQTVLAQVVRLVEQAQETRPKLGRLADRVVAWFVPVVLLVAAATFLTWGAVFHQWSLALNATVAVLVVACPCALGLATPTAIVVASGRAASRGILVRDAQALESAAFVDTVILDKTGTVTVGKPQLLRLRPHGGFTEEELLQVAATAEQVSLHPIARAVLEEAHRRGLRVPPAEAIEVLPGRGIRVSSEGHTIVLQTGSHKEAGQGAIEASIADGNASGVSKNAERSGASEAPNGESGEGVSRIIVSVLRDGEFLGWLELADLPAEESRQAITALRAMGLRVVMLTGDRAETARAVAGLLGIDEYQAGLTPPEKHATVRALREKGHCVAMVGDGINDAAALAEADVGIALGHGADIAKEAAAIVLIQRGLLGVVEVLRLGRATVRTIRRNLFWAFAYNVVLIPLAAGLMYPWLGILIPPVAAATAMAASSVSVVLSSLMLGRTL